jgi:hypothetical protein
MLFCVDAVFVLSYVGSSLVMGCSPVQGVLWLFIKLRNWSETNRYMDALCSKWEQREMNEWCRISSLKAMLFLYFNDVWGHAVA